MRRQHPLSLRLAVALFALVSLAHSEVISIESPMPPPAWAYAQRAVLKESVQAAIEFAKKYIDPRGHYRGLERWGGNDGPDDVMETFHNWPLAYSLGADDRILEAYERIWEGHLDQFQKAKAPSVEMARGGMYSREFITAFDWEHNGEGLAPFYHYGLCRPRNIMYRQRALRYAGFYNGGDPRYTVGLTRPRDLIDLRAQSEFIGIYNRIWADLQKEVFKSHERSAPQA